MVSCRIAGKNTVADVRRQAPLGVDDAYLCNVPSPRVEFGTFSLRWCAVGYTDGSRPLLDRRHRYREDRVSSVSLLILPRLSTRATSTAPIAMQSAPDIHDVPRNRGSAERTVIQERRNEKP